MGETPGKLQGNSLEVLHCGQARLFLKLLTRVANILNAALINDFFDF
jgi:hypothetical protein